MMNGDGYRIGDVASNIGPLVDNREKLLQLNTSIIELILRINSETDDSAEGRIDKVNECVS